MKRTSLKTAVFVPALAVLIAGIVALAITVGSVASASTSEMTDQLITSKIDENAQKFESMAMEPYSVASALSPILSDIAKRSENPRDDVLDVLISVLDADVLGAGKNIIGVWTGWEPNAIDGKDSQYVNAEYHDETGRFIPYVYRDGNGYGIAPLMDYEDPVAGDYIVTARKTGRPHVTDPFEYDVGGEIKSMYTISFPILDSDNTVLGVVGIDIDLERVISTINEASILDDGSIFVISPSGLYASHTDENLLMKSYTSTWVGNHSIEIGRLLSQGGSFSSTDYSDELMTDVIFKASGVMIGDTGNYWAVCGIVPQSTANAPSDTIIWLVIGVGFALIVITGLTIMLFIRRGLKEMPGITAMAERISRGDISGISAGSDAEPTKNEITLLQRAFGSISNSIKSQAEIMSRIADGDYFVSIPVRCDSDVMNKAINDMLDRTNAALHQIMSSSVQIDAGAKQIADGAQSLAHGSVEQASAIEHLSTSIGVITDMTNQNTGIAKEAADLSGEIKTIAETGNEQMGQMMQAVNDINDASNQIGKIIKVIDDIAFQTNILALNAAVEAARAGQHGKGFAVVAEEVRNLAAKSAEAAKDTGGMIENSIERANLGLSIATKTSDSLKEIVDGINRSAVIVAQIARSSEEQSTSIAQINTGIEQVAQVVTQNSATAEESAAASEEMSSQSNIMAKNISRFKLRDMGGHQALMAAGAGLEAYSSMAKRIPTGSDGRGERVAFDKYMSS